VTHDYPRQLPDAIPAGQVLVHNQVSPVADRQGARGSRYWLQPPADHIQVCICEWAPHLGQHYRVERQGR
jgi:hypothetical protein